MQACIEGCISLPAHIAKLGIFENSKLLKWGDELIVKFANSLLFQQFTSEAPMQ